MAFTIVGLPLGNAEDISLRALATLKKANVVICEDTRVFSKLWQKLANMGQLEGRFGGKLEILNDFNEKEKINYLVEKIINFDGEVVLVSDAGMPTFSDPGFRLVKELIGKNIKVEVVPGPTAMTTALPVSGFSSDRALFLGFLPKKESKREAIWEGIKNFGLGVTICLYESPRRVRETLMEIQNNLGDIEVVIARELTKEYEEIIRGKLSEVIVKAEKLKGEVVILFRFNIPRE